MKTKIVNANRKTIEDSFLDMADALFNKYELCVNNIKYRFNRILLLQ